MKVLWVPHKPAMLNSLSICSLKSMRIPLAMMDTIMMEKIKMAKRKKRRRRIKIRTRRIELLVKKRMISSRIAIPRQIIKRMEVEKQMDNNKTTIAVCSIKLHLHLVIQIIVQAHSQIELLRKKVPREREILHH
jgi:histone deacetylase complex regulatory component SIN3